MRETIEVCGMSIQLNKIKSIRLVKRDYLLCPSYQEIEEQNQNPLARLIDPNAHSFRFIDMVPYGAILSDDEKPISNSYEITVSDKQKKDKNTHAILSEISKAVNNVANVAADVLHIDTSGNKEFRIITRGHHTTTIKLKDIPAKVRFLSGKVSDLYKHDATYKRLGESISPFIATVSTMVVTVGKATYVFFGGGIDLDDAEAAYHALQEVYTRYHSEKRLSPFSLSKLLLSPQQKKATATNLPSQNLLRIEASTEPLALTNNSASNE